MARSSLPKSFTNLNLSRRQIALLEDIFMAGNEMSLVMDPKHPLPTSEKRAKLVRTWSYWMTKFAFTLL